jgi:hypothetical protein
VDEFATALRQSIQELSATILESKRLRMEFRTLLDLAHARKGAAGQRIIPERVEPFDWFGGYDGEADNSEQRSR